MSSCKKYFNQAFYFLSNLISALFILRIALYTFWNSEQVSELVKMLLQSFTDTPSQMYNNIYIYIYIYI